jgi:hypothetical protein
MKVLYTLFLICCLHPVMGQSIWQLQKDAHGIKVYTAESPETSVKRIRVETEFNKPMEKITSIIMNTSGYKHWVYGCIESSLISQISDSVVIYRHVTEVPWPFEDRDLASQFTKTKNKTTGVVSIFSVLKKDYPEQEGFVRVTYSTASWVLTPQKNGTIQAVYNLAFDPGGNIPAWLVNLFITEGPYETFINLQKLLNQ